MAGQRGSRPVGRVGHCHVGAPAGQGPSRTPPFQVQVVHRHAVASDANTQRECSTAQVWPAAAEDDGGQSVAGVRASHLDVTGAVVDHTPLLHHALDLQAGPRGSSPYSQRAPSVEQALEAAGHVDGQGAAWRVPAASVGQTGAAVSGPVSGLAASAGTPSERASGAAAEVEARHPPRSTVINAMRALLPRARGFVAPTVIARSNRNCKSCGTWATPARCCSRNRGSRSSLWWPGPS